MTRRRQDQRPGRVRGAGITILSVVSSGKREDETRYWVRYDCCTVEGELSGHSIFDRRRRCASMCQMCRPPLRKNKRPDRQTGRVPGAGIVIISVLKTGKAETKTRYLARYDCCGKVGEITGHSIKERIRNGSRTCAKCGNLQHERGLGESRLNVPDYGVSPPEWPVPRAELIGLHVPFYDRAQT